jgi:hypothetical protein
MQVKLQPQMEKPKLRAEKRSHKEQVFHITKELVTPV